MSGSGIAAALALLPASFAVVWALTWLGLAPALWRMRRWEGLPWIERSRRLYPVRQGARRNALAASVALAVFILTGGVAPLGAMRAAAPWAILGGMAGLFGGLDVASRFERRICRPVAGQPPEGIALRASFLVLALLPLAVMLALIPTRWGWKAAAVLALGAALVTFQQLGGWLWLVRRLGLAWPASDRLAAVVDHASARVGVHPRATFELASPHANALAMPVTRTLVFTAPILAALDDDELRAVAAHELGHLAEPRPVFLTRLLASYLVVVCVAGVPLAGSFGVVAGLTPVAVLLAGALLLKAVARRMEERADRVARAHEGDAEGRYARALEKIYEANLIPPVLRGKQVHPNLYDRMVAAGVTPGYDRPRPPARGWFSQGFACVVLVAAFARVVRYEQDAESRSIPMVTSSSSRTPSGSPAGDREGSPRPSVRHE